MKGVFIMNNKKECKGFNFTFLMNNSDKIDVKDFLSVETIKEASYN